MSDPITVKVPDIGGGSKVEVIEILVKPGDVIAKDASLITLESDKASMEIPSPYAGKVAKILLKLGDKVAEGEPILSLEMNEPAAMPIAEEKTSTEPTVPQQQDRPSEPSSPDPIQPAEEHQASAADALPMTATSASLAIVAGPAVRRMARELGVDLSQVVGQGRKNRVSKEDLHNFVKQRLQHPPSSSGGVLPVADMPVIDFSKFGSIESKPLNKIKKLTATNLHRAWVTVPHVTQFDEADVTELEAFRKSETEAAVKAGYKLTLLAFVTKAVCKALKKYPQFNASLDPSGQNLIFKQYFNIGIAVETANGLVVRVLKGVENLSVVEIALAMAQISQKARDKNLMPADMMGGCFTISSLGGIGGTAFTPIVNAPEVAILGLSRTSIKPVYQQGEFKPRLMLPLSLSYDHRVIDGAEAARFTHYLAELLGDIRRVLL